MKDLVIELVAALLAILALQSSIIYGSNQQLALPDNKIGRPAYEPRFAKRRSTIDSSDAIAATAVAETAAALPANVKQFQSLTSFINDDDELAQALPANRTKAKTANTSKRHKSNNHNNNNNNKNKFNKKSSRTKAALLAETRHDYSTQIPLIGGRKKSNLPSHSVGDIESGQYGRDAVNNILLKSKQRKLQKSQKRQNSNQNKRLIADKAAIKKQHILQNIQTPNQKSSTCRYAKSAWSECNINSNIRTRVLTLRRGDANCQPTRTMEKKCKKSCRYEKGTWSKCINGQMTRSDKLRNGLGNGSGGTSASASTSTTTSNSNKNSNKNNNNNNNNINCEPIRNISRKCNSSSKKKDEAATVPATGSETVNGIGSSLGFEDRTSNASATGVGVAEAASAAAPTSLTSINDANKPLSSNGVNGGRRARKNKGSRRNPSQE